jgi:magnesium transporter
MLGIVTVDDIIDVIDDEAQSDYSGLAGVNTDNVNQNPVQSAAKRLPWLVALLFLGMGTASLIDHFDSLVSRASVLAIFISLITGTAGNAGTQSLAVSVRRISINDEENRSFFSLILAEIATGLVTGAVTGLTIFAVVTLWKGNIMLGLAVGVAMFCAITVANLAGSLIPVGMDRLGFDPAVASGPFISTMSDLTSVFIYFSIAGMFIRFFN